MKKSVISIMAVFLIISCGVALAREFGLKQSRPKPHEFGNVIIDNYSTQNSESPVIFHHWLHRSKYTCRLCHVDIGFAMEIGGTDIRNEDIKNGLFCGTCHNNEIAFGQFKKNGKEQNLENCVRCHSYAREVKLKNDFYEFRKGMPRERFGNGIDWQVAEEKGKIKPIDYLEGISIKGDGIKKPEAFELKPTAENMPKIVFSHEKHNKWSGCELCHPEIFAPSKGSEPYSMEKIFEGRYCGVCHGPVAFPNFDCQRCHTELVY